MKTWSDSIVTFAAHISNHLGPVTKIIDSVTDRFVSTPVAKACPSYVCSSRCVFGYCYPGSGNTIRIDYVAYNWQQCVYGSPSCAIDVCGGC